LFNLIFKIYYQYITLTIDCSIAVGAFSFRVGSGSAGWARIYCISLLVDCFSNAPSTMLSELFIKAYA